MMFPQSLWWLPFDFVRETKKAHLEFKVCMQGLIHSKRAAKEEASDLISAFAQIRKGEELSDTEMLGNIFVFLFAGHETV
jgi:cytochrome P450